jgi:NADH-quinone oxidoreductase subunit J
MQLLGLRQAASPPGLALAPGAVARAAAEQGMVPAVARPLFGAYLVPFEITSILLLAAIVGAVVLAKRKL